jgi:hypothetical protein
MNRSEDLDNIATAKNNKGNLLKNLLLIAAALIMAVVLVNSMVTARTPVLTVSGETGEALYTPPACSCCSGNEAGSELEQMRQQALAFYNDQFEEDATDAVVEDYGCHQEILILKGEEPLRRLAYESGVFSDLGPLTDKQGN